MFLSDLQWSLLQPLFPPASRRRPACDDRLVLELIFVKIAFRLPWYDLPSSSPSWQTVYQRYHRLQSTGAWKSILKALLTDLNDRGGLNLLTAVENHEIRIQRDGAGRIEISFPPQYENTWQRTTAALLIHLLSSVL
jgi:transposase